MTARLRVGFAGTPDFARASLEAIVGAGFATPIAMTQPDRPSGRGMKLAPSPVKAFALERGVPVLQPRGLKLDGRFADDAQAAREAIDAAVLDVLVVAAYGLILPPWLLEAPRVGCLNVHASLLPRWRGAAPVQRAIEAGDAVTGVHLHQRDAGLDTGAMRLVRETPIEADDTAATLTSRLASIGAELLVDGLRALERGEPLPLRAQPHEGVTYAAKIEKREATIDWNESAEAIERRLRAFDPFPGAKSTLDGETIGCWRGRVVPSDFVILSGAKDLATSPGTVLAVEPDALVVACGEGALVLLELQRPGGRRLAAADFLRGRAPEIGSRFSAD